MKIPRPLTPIILLSSRQLPERKEKKGKKQKQIKTYKSFACKIEMQEEEKLKEASM